MTNKRSMVKFVNKIAVGLCQTFNEIWKLPDPLVPRPRSFPRTEVEWQVLWPHIANWGRSNEQAVRIVLRWLIRIVQLLTHKNKIYELECVPIIFKRFHSKMWMAPSHILQCDLNVGGAQHPYFFCVQITQHFLGVFLREFFFWNFFQLKKNTPEDLQKKIIM